MTADQIIEAMQKLVFSDREKIKTATIAIQYQKDAEIIAAIESSNIEAFDELLTNHINLNNHNFWGRLSSLDVAKIDTKMFHHLMKLDKKVPDITSEALSSMKNDYKYVLEPRAKIEGKKFNPLDVIKVILKEKLSSHLAFRTFTEEQFILAQTYLPEKFPQLQSQVVLKFASMPNIQHGYDAVHKYIKENNLIEKFFNSITSIEKTDFFLQDKDYNKYIGTLFREQKINTLMEAAISSGSIAKIKLLRERGGDFPNTKQCYSELFSKNKEEFADAQFYVVSQLDDITLGGQVILRTLLHFKNKGEKNKIILTILEKYTNEQIEILPVAWNKRDMSDEVELVQKFYATKMLEKELNESSNNTTSRAKYKL